MIVSISSYYKTIDLDFVLAYYYNFLDAIDEVTSYSFFLEKNFLNQDFSGMSLSRQFYFYFIYNIY